MNKPDDNEREERRQRLADERTTGDGSVDDNDANVYRVVAHAVRAAPLPQPPRGFAATLQSLVADFEEQAAFEQWMLRLAFIALGLLGVVAAWLAGATLIDHFAGAPWPLLLAAMAAGLVAWTIDRVAMNRSG